MGTATLPSLSIHGLNIQDEVGRGANSLVFRASRGVDTVAVKIPREAAQSFDEEAIRRFQREGSILACLTHPALPQVHEVGVSDGRPYIVLEYIEGDSLGEQLDDGPLSCEQLLRYGKALSGVLAELHSRGLVHCDVTPHNILRDPEGRVRLIDFGLAYGWGLDREEEAIGGTVAYASPEQTGMIDHPVDGRSDLYELGAVLYECATGSPPFTGERPEDVKRQHANAPVPDLADQRPDLPDRLVGLIEGLLAKEPSERPASARRLLTELQRCEVDEISSPRMFLEVATREASPIDQPFAGREHRLGQLRDLGESVDREGGKAAMITGPAGSGKTALVDRLLEDLSASSGLVLRVEGMFDEPYPHAPVRRMLQPLVDYAESLDGESRRVAHRTLREAMGEYAGVLQSIIPQLGGTGEARTKRPDGAGSEQVFRGVASMLSSLAEQAGGAVLVVDNAQQLDDATLEVLERLAIEAESAPLLILAVCDSEAGAERLDDVTDSLGEILALQVELGPLSPEAIEELIRAHLGERPVDMRVVERVTTLSYGNPYAAAAYVRSVLDSAVLRPTWSGWEVDESAFEALDLPDELSALLVERLEQLSERAMDVIGWLSIFSTSVPFERLTDCVDLSRRRLQEAIGEVHRHRLVEIDASGRYRLVHDEIRRGALERLDADELQGRHQRAAEVLDDGTDDPDRLYRMAHHYSRGRVGENPERAFELNYRASLLASERLAYERAFQFGERAAAIAEEYGLEVGGEFHETLGDIANRTSRLSQAERHFEAAIAAASEPLRRAELYGYLADVCLGEYDNQRAHEFVERGFEAIGEPFPQVSVRNVAETLGQWLVGEAQTVFRTAPAMVGDERRLDVLFLLNQVAQKVAYFAMDNGLMAQAGIRSLRLAQRLDDERRMAEAHASHAVMLTVLGLQSRAIDHMDRARLLADRSEDPFVIGSVKVYDWLISDFRGEPDRAERIIRDLFDRESVMLESFEYLAGNNTLVHHFSLRSQFGEAVDLTERALKLLQARFGKESPHLAVLYSNLSVAYTVLGIEENIELFERIAEEHKPGHGDPIRLAYHLQCQLARRVERGEWGEETERVIEEREDLGYDPGEMRYYQGLFYVYVCFLRLHQIEFDVVDFSEGLDRLDEALAALEAVADTCIYRCYLTLFQAARARLAGDQEEAIALLERAQQQADRHTVPVVSFEVARNRALLMHESNAPSARDRYLRTAVSIAADEGWETHLQRLRRQFVGIVDEAADRDAFGTTVGSSGSTTLTANWGSEQLACLQQIDEIVSDYAETSDQLEQILGALIELFGAERARFFSIDGESGLRLRAGRSVDADEAEADDEPLIRQLAEEVYRTQDRIFVGSEREEDPSGRLADSPIRSVLATPIYFRGRTAGIVYLDSRLADGVFRQEDHRFLQLAGDYLVLLLTHGRVAQLEQRIADTGDRSAALLEHATRAVEIGIATMQPDRSLARTSPTVHTMVEAWPTTAVWWEELLAEVDWTDPPTCQTCGKPEYVGEVKADLVDPSEGERHVFAVTSTGHGHELTETPGEHVLLVRNITEQFETNEELKRMNRQLTVARDQAMAASEAKNKFLARMSHEFRTPLSGVIGYTELLLEEPDPEPEQMKGDLENILASAEQLQRLIGGVLDLTKVDSGHLDLEVTEVDAEGLLAEVASTLGPMFDKTGNELVVEVEDFEMRTDETKLRQLLLNLLRNAAKFTDEGTVRVSAEPHASGRRALFEIEDDGIGMSEEEQEQIFEAFYQVDQSSTSEFRGTGLGLTLVQRFIDRLDGTVEVDSEPGEGSTFRVDIAAELDEEAAAARHGAPTQPTAPAEPVDS